MTLEKRLFLSKTFIFASASLAVLASFWIDIIAPSIGELHPVDAFSVPWTISGLFLSVLFLSGVYMGSRGVGRPLTISAFFKLVFGFPCWIPFAVYFAAQFFGFFYWR